MKISSSNQGVHNFPLIAPRRPSRIFGRRIVKRQFQLRFSFIIFTLFLLVVLLNWIVGNMAIRHMVEMGLVSNDQFLIQLKILNGIIVKCSTLGLIFIYVACLLFSHSIAGPIYRFEQILAEMASGNLNLDFKLRRMDEFKEVADLFSRA